MIKEYKIIYLNHENVCCAFWIQAETCSQISNNKILADNIIISLENDCKIIYVTATKKQNYENTTK